MGMRHGALWTPAGAGRLALAACLFLALALSGCGTVVPVSESPVSRGSGKRGQNVVETVRNQVGTPYRNGGDSPSKGFDCSGLTSYCFAAHGAKIPRRAEDQYECGKSVGKNDLLPGDLVFFRTGSRTWGNMHVGIYVGRGRFVHAPRSGSPVREESMAERYWVDHYLGARRVMKNAGPSSAER